MSAVTRPCVLQSKSSSLVELKSDILFPLDIDDLDVLYGMFWYDESLHHSLAPFLLLFLFDRLIFLSLIFTLFLCFFQIMRHQLCLILLRIGLTSIFGFIIALCIKLVPIHYWCYYQCCYHWYIRWWIQSMMNAKRYSEEEDETSEQCICCTLRGSPSCWGIKTFAMDYDNWRMYQNSL